MFSQAWQHGLAGELGMGRVQGLERGVVVQAFGKQPVEHNIRLRYGDKRGGVSAVRNPSQAGQSRGIAGFATFAGKGAGGHVPGRLSWSVGINTIQDVL
jgi:hypothetical protein